MELNDFINTRVQVRKRKIFRPSLWVCDPGVVNFELKNYVASQ